LQAMSPYLVTHGTTDYIEKEEVIMDTMEKASKRSLLLDEGIILQSDTICWDKINSYPGR
jgi:hypothetical protein